MKAQGGHSDKAGGTAVASPTSVELVERIGWLITLRWLAVFAVVGTIEVARRVGRIELPTAPLYGLVAGLALYNASLSWFVRRTQRRNRVHSPPRSTPLLRALVPRPLWNMQLEGAALQAAAFASVQMALDLLFLTLLLHFSGGLENPFVYCFVFHSIVASVLLSRRAAYAQTTLALVLASALGWAECVGIVAHHPLGNLWAPGAYRNAFFVAAQLVALGANLYLSVYLCSSVAARLRRRTHEIIVLSDRLARQTVAVRRSYEQLSRLERAKSRHMRVVAHELRGPLGTIQTALTVVLEGMAGRLPDGARDLLERATRRARGMTAVTDDLLDLARAEAPPTGERTRIELAALIDEVVAGLGDCAAERGVTIRTEVSPELRGLEGDPVGLAHLVGNLLSNAVRYTRRGGHVTIRARNAAAELVLEVEDTGIGIPPQDVDRVFEEFFRSKNARDHAPEGTGLGLAIVHAVVAQHDGAVTVDSQPGRGTTVAVRLPAERSSALAVAPMPR